MVNNLGPRQIRGGILPTTQGRASMLTNALDRLLISAIPPRAGDLSKGSWPERVNHGVAMDFGFDFLRTRPFAGAIAHSQLAGLRMFSVTCEPHFVYRAPQHVTGSPDSHYLLTLQVTGAKGVEQYGKRTRLTAGHFAVYDSDAPLTLDVGRDYRSINVRFPKAVIGTRAHAVFEQLLVEPLSVQDGIAPVVWTMLVGLEQHAQVSGPHAFEVSRHAVDLASLMLASCASDGDSAFDARSSRLTQVKHWLDAHLGDADLTVERAAAANFMSVRTVHKLFSDSGETAAAWIRCRRIDAVKRELADPAEDRPIAAIAAAWGFTAVSHFSQVFRSVVGMSPSDFRTHARLAGDSPV